MTTISSTGILLRCVPRLLWVTLALAAAISPSLGQTATPPSDPQATQFAALALKATTSGQTLKDVTLTGQATWSAGDQENGAVTLKALGTGESRMDIVLSGGTRTEIRDASAGFPQGKWLNPDGTSGQFAGHNTMTDAVWFFPALGALGGGQNIVLKYVGLESRNGEPVQHLQSYVFQQISNTAIASPLQQLSTMDFYLDAVTFLPVSVSLKTHPDNNAAINLLTEVDFANYQSIGGFNVPTHIQRYQQGTLMLDVSISDATFNTGIPIAAFSTN